MSYHDPFAPFASVPVRYHPDIEKLRIVALIHKAAPWHGAGAEWMMHCLLREMVRRGHEAHVLVNQPLRAATAFQGVTVERYRHPRQMADANAHVAVTHLDLSRFAISGAQIAGLPLVHLLHNHRQLQYHRIRPADAQLCIANSEWIRESYRDWPGPMDVVHPPVEVDEYEVLEPTGEDMVTLLNLSVPKGGELFWRLAWEMPHRRFLAVVGAYATQHIPPDRPSNVTMVANTPKVVDEVYARTKVLLMPSGYESWGRCAIEAGCSGIPAVAHPTPGLVESLGSAGTWCDRDQPEQWVQAIDRLLDSETDYASAAVKARKRAEELDPRQPGGSYDRFEQLMLATARGTLAEVVA